MKKLLLSALLCIAVSAVAQNTQIQKDTIVVARDGSGDFRTLTEVMERIRGFRPSPTVVYVKRGIYKEKLVLPTWINEVKFIGEDRDATIITYDDHARIDNMGTFRSYTFLVQGNGITFENLTIENNAPRVAQAVAAHLEGDRLSFRNCRFLGNQDTLFTGREGGRSYFEECYIEGTTDYIFGGGIAWFERCTLHCKTNSYLTAASTPQTQPYGYIFNQCRITLAEGVNKMHLGRPWRPYAMTVFMHCTLPQGIVPQGWHNWGKVENETTARYGEYNNTGAGASLDARPPWIKRLSHKEASELTVQQVMKGCQLDWNPKQ